MIDTCEVIQQLNIAPGLKDFLLAQAAFVTTILFQDQPVPYLIFDHPRKNLAAVNEMARLQREAGQPLYSEPGSAVEPSPMGLLESKNVPLVLAIEKKRSAFPVDSFEEIPFAYESGGVVITVPASFLSLKFQLDHIRFIAPDPRVTTALVGKAARLLATEKPGADIFVLMEPYSFSRNYNDREPAFRRDSEDDNTWATTTSIRSFPRVAARNGLRSKLLYPTMQEFFDSPEYLRLRESHKPFSSSYFPDLGSPRWNSFQCPVVLLGKNLDY